MADALDLPLKLYEKFLRESQSYRTSYIVLTGGEPTLHPDFEALLKLTARYQYRYTLVTNGSTFDRIYPALFKYRDNLSAVYFSLDGAEEEIHDTIRQQPGSYRKVLQACMICYRKQIPFRLTMVLHRRNIGEIEAVLLLASKLGAEAVQLGVAQLTRELVARNLACSPDERRRLEEKLVRMDDTPYISVYPTMDMFIENPCFPCSGLQMSGLYLDYKGCIRFCCQLPRNDCDSVDIQKDVIGSLENSSVWELHRRLIGSIAAFQQTKVQRVEQRSLSQVEHFPCYYCANYFHKLGWLKDFPDSEWNSVLCSLNG